MQTALDRSVGRADSPIYDWGLLDGDGCCCRLEDGVPAGRYFHTPPKVWVPVVPVENDLLLAAGGGSWRRPHWRLSESLLGRW